MHNRQKYIISNHAIDRIKNYSYSGKDLSFISKYYYPICNFIIKYIPIFVSPNLITLFGLFTVISSTISLLYFSFLPISIRYIICGISLFIYQLCDTIDGLQGKRTGMYYNPTTELFDHGCDSMVLTSSMSTLHKY